MNANAQRHTELDGTIDRALSALRDTQPRSGLEGRILASLQHRTTVLGGPSFRFAKGWGVTRGSARENADRIARLTLWAATSAAVLAIASLVILHRPGAPPSTRIARQGGFGISPSQPDRAAKADAVILSERSESKNPDGARRATNPKPFSATNLAQTTHTLSSRPERATGVPGQLAGWGGAARSGEAPVFRNCPAHHESGCPIHDDNVVMGGVATTPTDAQLLADLHAPSHPAPPLPLTPQEKLFLRMLHYGNATELAELDPMVRAKQDADETTAFKAFFPDPPPLQQPNGDTE